MAFAAAGVISNIKCSTTVDYFSKGSPFDFTSANLRGVVDQRKTNCFFVEITGLAIIISLNIGEKAIVSLLSAFWVKANSKIYIAKLYLILHTIYVLSRAIDSSFQEFVPLKQPGYFSTDRGD